MGWGWDDCMGRKRVYLGRVERGVLCGGEWGGIGECFEKRNLDGGLVG